MSNNNQPIRKSTYSTTTVFIIVGVLSLVFIIIYLYNYYKTFAAKLLIIAHQKS